MAAKRPTNSELKETVALAHRVLFLSGLATAAGHASARIPGTDRFLIKSWPHVHMSRLRAEDIITMDLDGNILEGKKENTTRVGEWPLHSEIYRAHPDVGAVIHTHQPWATLLGILGKTILPVLHPGLASVAAEPMPVFDEDYALITRPAQGRVLAQVLGNAIGCHLRTHGMVFAGPTLEIATTDAIHTEYEAEVTWRAMLIGTPRTIPMLFLRPALERRNTGQVPEAWEDYWKWIDKHQNSPRFRTVQV
ncbi:MAG: class II aldolase/adducin family protein [Chloroflexi bacterium]|nr:class II aldolase/adducin family protein [Chloroflexota bacterium]